MAKRFLTLNIGAANIELAEYEQGGRDALTLVKYGIAALAAPLDGGNAETILAPALLELVREKGFKPGKVALSVSGQMVFPKFAAIPRAGGNDKFEQMVRYEIEQGIPFPIDEMVCDRQVLGETENGDTSVMIVAAKVDQIESITAAVQSAGFQPDLVDVAPISLINAIRFNRPDDDACVVALDIGAKTTSLVIVEGDKVYTRSIPVAGNSVTKEIANALGCSNEEAESLKISKGYVSLGGVTEDEDEQADQISKACRATMTRLNAEISRSINFYRSQQHGSAPTRLYLTGGTALLPQIDAFFSEAIGIEVEYLNPFERINVASSVDSGALESDVAMIAVTAGLAVHEAAAARFAINLLPPSIVKEQQEKARIPFLAIGGVCLVLAFVLLGLGFGNETAVVNEQAEAVQERVSKLSAFDKKITAASENLSKIETESRALKDLFVARGAALQRLNTVRQALLPGMWISAWEKDRVTIRYWADNKDLPQGKPPSQAFAERLQAKPTVAEKSVKISEMSSIGAAISGQKAPVEQFTVEVKFK